MNNRHYKITTIDGEYTCKASNLDFKDFGISFIDDEGEEYVSRVIIPWGRIEKIEEINN